MSAGTGSLLVCVVAHTHWDREWYHPAGRFRQRLVALIDELLDQPGGAPFLLDGQAVVLEDYLNVRPEREPELRARLADGALEAGPWYVLADELIPTGESLVHNLLAGAEVLRRLGAEAPPVLYSPDAFGHPAALPTLAAGFALPLAIVWRGYGGGRWPAGDTARWVAPDGSSVVLLHLPPAGYEFGASLPTSDAAAARRWHEIVSTLAPRSRTGVLLVLNGADHHARQRSQPEAVAALARAAAPVAVRACSLACASREVLRRALPAIASLAEVRGELRDSSGYTWALQGTLAARAEQKRRHAAVERLLVRDAAPWAAVAVLAGGALRTHLVRAAWRTLLICQPHDTLCGTSIDAVARALDQRLEDVASQAAGLRDDALGDLAGFDPEVSRDRFEEWQPAVVVRNAAARPRGGIAELEIETFLAHEGVGPDAAGQHVQWQPPAAPVVDAGRVAVQVLGETIERRRVESARHYPDNDVVRVTRAVAWVPRVRGYSTRTLPLTCDPAACAAHTGARQGVRCGRRTLRNQFLTVRAAAGRVSVADAAGTWRVHDLLAFEEIGDRGDLYTHSPVGAPVVSARFRHARLRHSGPLRGTMELTYRWRVPSTVGGWTTGGTAARRTELATMTATVTLTLDAGAPFLRVSVRGHNAANDHRLRIALATGGAVETTLADAMFGPVERRVGAPDGDEGSGVREVAPPTAPLHRYVSLYDGRAGVTVFSDGLAEYEATREGRVLVTLVRCVGELSRDGLPERPGHAGWPAPVPLAQSIGPYACELAVMPHGPRSPATLDEVERAADDVLLPLTGTTYRALLRVLPPRAYCELRGAGLVVSAIENAREGSAVVLRCVNVTTEPVAGAWRLSTPGLRAWLARLDESRLRPLPVVGRVIRFSAPARGVVTILFDGGPGGDESRA